MDRGLLIAHKETWDQFIRQRESNPHRMMFNETDDVLVVFEGMDSSLSLLVTLPQTHPLTNPTNHNPAYSAILTLTLTNTTPNLHPCWMIFYDTNDMLIDVFLDDVYETVPNIKQAMISEIENMNSDIKYLGWCMWSDKKLAPLCMHAYAMDANGARYVLSFSHRFHSM